MSALTFSSQIHGIQQTSMLFILIIKIPGGFDILLKTVSYIMSYPSGIIFIYICLYLFVPITYTITFDRLRILMSLLYDTHYLLRVSLDIICLSNIKFVIYSLFNLSLSVSWGSGYSGVFPPPSAVSVLSYFHLHIV